MKQKDEGFSENVKKLCGGEEIMKKRRTIGLGKGRLVLLLIAIGLAVFLGYLPVYAQCVGLSAAADADSDGFSDLAECQGFTAVDGSFITTNWNSKDLFVYLVPGTTSNFPVNSLEYITNSISAGGLGIAAHPLNPAYATDARTITLESTQKAIRITESLEGDPNNTGILGYANYGTPNGLDNAIIYTQRIINFINTKCAGKTSCQDSTGLSGDALKAKYINHTIAHEAAHMMNLTTTYDSRLGGYHYKTGTNVILDQSVYYTDKSGKVTWFIGTNYTAADQTGAKLK